MSVSFLLFAVLILSLSATGAEISGKATHYVLENKPACSFYEDPSIPTMYVAYSEAAWDNAINCGRCVRVTNSAGTSVVVRIIDRCPECAQNHLDMSEDSFKKLGKLETGVLNIKYDFVPCPTTGNIKYRVKKDSTKWWISVLVDNHRVGVKKFEIKGKNTNWISVTRASYNEFEQSQPSGFEPPVSFRVTSIDGEVITDENIIKNENFPGTYTSSKQFGPDDPSSSSSSSSSVNPPSPTPGSSSSSSSASQNSGKPSSAFSLHPLFALSLFSILLLAFI